MQLRYVGVALLCAGTFGNKVQDVLKTLGFHGRGDHVFFRRRANWHELARYGSAGCHALSGLIGMDSILDG